MATKLELMMQKAKDAQRAKLEGRTQEFISTVNAAPASTPQSAPKPTASSTPSDVSHAGLSKATKKNPFGNLSRGTLTDEEVEHEEHEETKPLESISPATESKSTAAPAAPAPSRFSDLSRLSKARQSNGQNPAPPPQSMAKRVAPVAVEDPPWTDDTTPAGSAYSSDEWMRARQFGTAPGSPDVRVGGYCVFEMRNGGQGALIAIPKRPETQIKTVITGNKKAPISTKVEVQPDPKDCIGTMDPLMVNVFDGCLVLAPTARTTHPGAISGEMVMKASGGRLNDIAYKIVRPESQRETQFWLYGLKGTFEQDALGAKLNEPVEPEINTEDLEEVTRARDSLRG